MKDATILKLAGILGVASLGITYFLVVRHDGTVLLALSSLIGGIVGYITAQPSK